MRGVLGRQTSSPFQYRWVHLLLVWMIGGCATSGSVSTSAPHPARSSRTLRAMSDGPSFNGESPGSSVQGYNVPGRNPNSQMPWEFFLGNAAHRLIAYMYGVDHPQSEVSYNQVSLSSILSEVDIGDPSRLREDEMLLRPDITDVSLRWVFAPPPPRSVPPLRVGEATHGTPTVHISSNAVLPSWLLRPGTPEGTGGRPSVRPPIPNGRHLLTSC